MRVRIVSIVVLLIAVCAIGWVFYPKSPFEKEHAHAAAKNPPGLDIEIDTVDHRREYRESEYINFDVKYSSQIRYRYKADVGESYSVSAASDELHISNGKNMLFRNTIACCGSKLVGLDTEPYVYKPYHKVLLKPGKYQMYVTTRRVFLWSAGQQEYGLSPLETASSLLRIRVVPDPGWQERRLAVIQQSLTTNPNLCAELNDLDAPAAMEEKRRQIEADTPCGRYVKQFLR